jgi:hypothetical protein
VSRTGLAGRAPAGLEGFACSTLTSGPARFIGQPFAFRDDLPARVAPTKQSRCPRSRSRTTKRLSPLRYATCGNSDPHR